MFVHCIFSKFHIPELINQTSMAVLISDLTIFSTELVSILRAKLWKLKMECKNGVFQFLGPFSQNAYF